jgi:hypothetical protein
MPAARRATAVRREGGRGARGGERAMEESPACRVRRFRDYAPNKGSGGLRSACGVVVGRVFLGRPGCLAHRPHGGSEGRTPQAYPLFGL